MQTGLRAVTRTLTQTQQFHACENACEILECTVQRLLYLLLLFGMEQMWSHTLLGVHKDVSILEIKATDPLWALCSAPHHSRVKVGALTHPNNQLFIHIETHTHLLQM